MKAGHELDTSIDEVLGMKLMISKYIPKDIVVFVNMEKVEEAMLKGESIAKHIAILDLREEVQAAESRAHETLSS